MLHIIYKKDHDFEEIYPVKNVCKGAYLSKELAMKFMTDRYVLEEEEIDLDSINEDVVYVLVRHGLEDFYLGNRITEEERFSIDTDWFFAGSPYCWEEMDKEVKENMFDEHPNYQVCEIRIMDYRGNRRKGPRIDWC